MSQLTLGAHVPWGQVDLYLDLVLKLQIVPEIAIKGPELDLISNDQVSRVENALSRACIRPRIHAPFFDLNPGALDPLIREVTFTRLSQTLDIARKINADLVVIHPGVDKWRYPNLETVWREHAVRFFPRLIAIAATFNCRLAIENIYEEDPGSLVKLVDTLDSEWFGHCYDVGHWHLFGRRPMAEWLEAIGPKLFHLHLHDNHGRADEHLPVGDGTIDFLPLQQFLSNQSTWPSATLEAHSEDHLKRSLQRVIELQC